MKASKKRCWSKPFICIKAVRFYLFVFITMFHFMNVQAGIIPTHASIAYINNAVAMPFSGYLGIIHTPSHPGALLSVEKNLHQSKRIMWTQDLSISFIQQRLIHSVISFYTSNRLAFIARESLQIELALQGGYAHVINTKENSIYKWEYGAYQSAQKFGRPSFCFGVQPGISYAIGGTDGRWKPFLRYRFTMIAPFVKSYVPLLPNAALELGVTMKLKKQ